MSRARRRETEPEAATWVRYGSLRTPWGRIWAANSAEGVIRIAVGSAPVGKLVEEVQRRHPARMVHDLDAIGGLLEDLARFLQGRLRDLGRWAPDYGGLGPFARRVYEATRRIPYGHRVTYGQLAREVNGGRHARPVGTILARNPFRLLVPDHRVVPARGGPGGYAAGEGWKARLLALESGQTALDWATAPVRRV